MRGFPAIVIPVLDTHCKGRRPWVSMAPNGPTLTDNALATVGHPTQRPQLMFALRTMDYGVKHRNDK